MNRERRGGRTNHASVKVARKELRKAIRESKSECWITFVQEAEGDKVWMALKYTGKQGELTVKDLQKQEGGLATSWNEKAELKKEVRFPKLLPGTKKQGKEEGGETFM
jgi:hypothetical protein